MLQLLYVLVTKQVMEIEGYISNTSGYFNVEFEKEWLLDEFNIKALKKIDNVDIIANELLYNEIMGYIPPNFLSTGVKTLILANTLGLKVNGDRMGDNCYPLLVELSKKKDVYIKLTHLPKFEATFQAVYLNNNRLVNNWKEFANEYFEVMYK